MAWAKRPPSAPPQPLPLISFSTSDLRAARRSVARSSCAWQGQICRWLRPLRGPPRRRGACLFLWKLSLSDLHPACPEVCRCRSTPRHTPRPRLSECQPSGSLTCIAGHHHTVPRGGEAEGTEGKTGQAAAKRPGDLTDAVTNSSNLGTAKSKGDSSSAQAATTDSAAECERAHRA